FSSFIMCDSDDDEFVSASEGEEEDLHKQIPVEKPSIDQSHLNEESEEEEESDGEESGENQNQSDGDQSEKEEEDNSVEDEVDQTDSKPVHEVLEEKEAKKEQIEEKITEATERMEGLMKDDPDIAPLTFTGVQGGTDLLCSENKGLERRESTSTSSGEGKEKKDWEKVEELDEQSSLDEGKSGWDDWGEESVEVPEKEKETTPKVESKPVEEEESADGWDDWGNEEMEAPSNAPEPRKGGTGGPSKSAHAFEARREEMLSKLGGSTKAKTGGSGWGWGGVLSGIGETFSSAVESSLGLPSAQELARKHAEVEKMEGENPMVPLPLEPSLPSTQPQSSIGGFGMLSGIVNGGIDVLESIGKKTFETITVREEEKGRRRFIFEAERGENLSDVLKELREKNEAEAAVSASAGHSPSPARLPDMASSFERSDGMVHLEALELVATNRPKQRPSVHRQLMALLENERVDVIDNEDDFASELRHAVKETGLPYSPDGIITVDHELDARLRSGNGMSSEELFKEGVDSLAQFTAASVHLVSKLASLVAVMGGSDFSPFVSIYRILSTRCTHIANLYMLAISASDSGSSADELGTQVLVEASTAIDFIRQAHVLIIPIIEVK
ncbi:hypothetical protein PENTCL1PPCAC_26161, partial [Pristionchus entomophagus]